MGNLISLHNNDLHRLHTILNFFCRSLILKTSTTYESNVNLETVKLIIESIENDTFESLKIILYDDIILNENSNIIVLEKDSSFYIFNEIIKSLRIYEYEKEFKFFNTENQIVLSFSLVKLEDNSDEEIDEMHLCLTKLRNNWIKKGRLPINAGLGTFGIII